MVGLEDPLLVGEALALIRRGVRDPHRRPGPLGRGPWTEELHHAPVRAPACGIDEPAAVLLERLVEAIPEISGSLRGLE